MELPTMQELLSADEDSLRSTLRADRDVEKDRDRSVETLREELGSLLLRYNAACANDRTRQALADGMTAVARDTAELLKAAGAEKEEGRRETSPWAPLLLAGALILAAAALLLLREQETVRLVCLAASLLISFLAGRLWTKERRVRVRATLDPDALCAGTKRSVETIDRKIEEFCQKAQAWAEEERAAGEAAAQSLSPEALALYGDLLEALYAGSGELALLRLKKLPPYLHALGVETEDYTGGNADRFELFPSRRETATQRPALVAGERVLLAGRATETEETRT